MEGLTTPNRRVSPRSLSSRGLIATACFSKSSKHCLWRLWFHRNLSPVVKIMRSNAAPDKTTDLIYCRKQTRTNFRRILSVLISDHSDARIAQMYFGTRLPSVCLADSCKEIESLGNLYRSKTNNWGLRPPFNYFIHFSRCPAPNICRSVRSSNWVNTLWTDRRSPQPVVAVLTPCIKYMPGVGCVAETVVATVTIFCNSYKTKAIAPYIRRLGLDLWAFVGIYQASVASRHV